MLAIAFEALTIASEMSFETFQTVKKDWIIYNVLLTENGGYTPRPKWH